MISQIKNIILKKNDQPKQKLYPNKRMISQIKIIILKKIDQPEQKYYPDKRLIGQSKNILKKGKEGWHGQILQNSIIFLFNIKISIYVFVFSINAVDKLCTIFVNFARVCTAQNLALAGEKIALA